MMGHPKRHKLNDWNLGVDGGRLHRGSLTPGEGVAVGEVAGSLMRVLGNNVRNALAWRIHRSHDKYGRNGLVRLLDGLALHDRREEPLPFGWMARRIVGRDVFEIGPVWVFIPDLLREAWWKFVYAAERVRALEIRWTSTGSELRWWPTMPRFSYEDEVRGTIFERRAVGFDFDRPWWAR